MPSTGLTRRAALSALVAAAPLSAEAKGKHGKPVGGCAAAATSFGEFAGGRVASTFAAERTGRLRQIRVGVFKAEVAAGSWVVQLVPVAGGIPASLPEDVYAANTIPDDAIPNGLSTATVAFAGTPIVAGITYAVVVSRVGGPVGVGTVGNDACPGNALFWAMPGRTFAAVGRPSFPFSVLVD